MKIMKIDRNETDEIRPAFINFAMREGIDMEHPEDWIDWWKCWLDGYNQAINDVTLVIREIADGNQRVQADYRTEKG
jgi:hypothetical protein